MLKKRPDEGYWVSDGYTIVPEWSHGVDVRAINYCIDPLSSNFISMQVILGHSGVLDDEELVLLKHGGDGGSCNRWSLNDNDYINRIEYTYDREYGFMTSVKFLT